MQIPRFDIPKIGPSGGKGLGPGTGPGGGKAIGPGGRPGQQQGQRALRKGMSGMDVARCQNLLNKQLAFAPPPLWVDGIFGAKTDKKVRDFQMKRRLAVDGIVGPMTRAVLEGA